MGKAAKTAAGYIDIFAGLSAFIWADVIITLILTLVVRDPCKGRKCLVKACCKEFCELKVYYNNFCDRDGSIAMQRFCAIMIIFMVCFLTFVVIKWINF
jgi:hypothetical protein